MQHVVTVSLVIVAIICLVCSAAHAAGIADCESIPAGLSGKIEARQDTAPHAGEDSAGDSGRTVYQLLLSPKSARSAAELLANCVDEALPVREVQLSKTGGDEREFAKHKGRTVHLTGSLRPGKDEPAAVAPIQFQVDEIIRPE